MKKTAIKLMIMLFTLMSVVAFAGDSTIVVTATPDVPVESTEPSAMNTAMEFFFSISGVVLLVQIVTGWILKTLPIVGKTLKQMTSWVVSVALAFVGSKYDLGIFADASLVYTLSVGVGIGMVANYLYDAKTLESILSIFFANKNKA